MREVSTLSEDATGADVAAYHDGALGRLAVALILWGLGTVALVWFLGLDPDGRAGGAPV